MLDALGSDPVEFRAARVRRRTYPGVSSGVHNAVPIDREKVLQAAQKYVEKRRFDRAIAEYQRILQEDPNDARILLKVGDLQARMDAHVDAIATYERVARHYAQQGFAVKAIAVYKQIREMIRKYVPRVADQYGHIIPKLAELYQQLGLTGDALTTYDEYATMLQSAGRDSEAIEVFRKIVQLNGTNPLARLRLAEALSRNKSSDEAIAEFSKAADILLEMGRTDDALKVIERLLHHRPDPVRARQAAELYLNRGQASDGMLALAKLQISFQADQRNLETLALLARAFVAIGQLPKAMEVRKEAARIAKDQGKLDEARRILDELLAAMPDDEGVRALARTLMQPSVAPPARPAVRAQEDAVIEVSAEEPAPLEPDMDLGLDETGTEDFEGYLTEDVSSDLSPQAPVIRVQDGLEAAEDVNVAPMSYRGAATVPDVIANAEAFRSLQQLSKAAETLRIALELNPLSFELHMELKEVLLDAGDTRGALDELITLAAMYADAGQTVEAATMLSEAISVDPYHHRAREMLFDLGYEPPPLPSEEQYDAAMATAEALAGYEQPFGYDYEEGTAPSFESTGPLPSYDLEEIAPAQAMQQVPPSAHAPSHELLSTDDPFAVEAVGDDLVGDEGMDPRGEPLPSFPLLAEDKARLELVAAEEGFAEEDRTQNAPLPSGWELEPQEQVYEPAGEPQPVSAPPLASTVGFQGGDSLEDALEEAEFFATRSLYDDALSIIDEQLTRFPGHPLLIERQREFREALATANGSGEREVPQGAPSTPPLEDHSFDIAASLSALDDFGPVDKGTSTGGAVDVEAVFAKFKEGVRQQVAETDAQSHYDLGVAYKEMGLINDALTEFELASRDPSRECVCHSMAGMMHLEQGNLEAAIEAFIRGLHAEQKSADQELALYYELGNTYQLRSNPREALFYFQKVMRRDAGYRDVAARVRALQPKPAVAGGPGLKTAVGEDEFDRAFDDVFGNK